MFKKIAVIGLGNSLRRDDGIGVIILGSLLNNYKDNLSENPKDQIIDCLNFGVASFDLMHRLQDYDAALLIDGVAAGLSPGELRIFKLEEIAAYKEEGIVSSHELNLKDIFRLTRNLGIKTEIYIAGIQVQDVGFGESLSRPLQESLGRITEQIAQFIRERLSK
ncbi:MAG: hydrogenase maturation protease [Candidatus Omnitrophica bacterium]|nr:hydrogenase maturation protease [Candidatus Omnitrophota bacterium]